MQLQHHKHPQQPKHHTVHPDGCTVRTVHLEFVSKLSGCAMVLLTAHKAGTNSHKTVQVIIYINLFFYLFLVSLFLYIYRKIPKISPRAYIFQRPFLRGLSMEGNLLFKIDWASLIFRRKFTVFAFL